MVVNDTVGTGATGIVATEGVFERIEVIDQGYDYVDTPTISITGGNPTVAEAEANMVAINHILPFNSGEESGGGNGVIYQIILLDLLLFISLEMLKE